MIPVNFVVGNVGDDDLDVPLIFGRPFLATCRAIIDVGKGKLTLRVGNEEAKFTLASLDQKGNVCTKGKVKAKAVTPPIF